MPRSYTVTDPTGVLTINFNETSGGLAVPDDSGVYWMVEELEGWDGPDVRQVLIDTYGEDGVAVGVNELSSRLITLSNGFAAAPSEATKWAAQSQFGQLLAATVPQGMCTVVVHEDIDRTIKGYLASKPEWKDVPPGSLASYLPGAWPFQFEASLVCPNPLKGSTNGDSPFELTRDGSAAIPTLGNYPTPCVLHLEYPCNNDYIEDQAGNRITITTAYRGSNYAPPMPTDLYIDTGARTVYDQDGNPAWDCIASVGWFQLLPNGGSTLTYHLGSSSPSGTQEAYAAWYDAWL